ncbi:MAG: transglycosylase domain-containing protein [Bacteroidales bacterium]|nr:transglycosylase domain-containing protein [Bacteroidales bacterium]
MSLTKKLWLIFAGLWTSVIMLFVGISLGWFGFMPTFEELENPRTNLATEIISSDGVVLGTFFIENRVNVDYSQLSPYLIQALVATEDERFHQHSGIDARALMRVVVRTVMLQQGGQGGGSTISQQLAKNLFPREHRNTLGLVMQKFREWVIAVRLERSYTKEEIIAMYFNTVDFGNNSFGVQTAANTYFGVNQENLKVEEAALLVGILQAPSFFSPVRHPERATRRRDVVLGQMLRAGYLTREEHDSIRQVPLDMSRFRQQDHRAGLAPYFREFLRMYVRDWIANNPRPDGTRHNLYRDGLRIYTTIDSRMQRYAEEAVAEHLSNNLQPAFFRQLRHLRNPPFSNNISSDDARRIVTQSMRRSDRYRQMRRAGASNSEIEEAFHTPVRMRVFSWQGTLDTVMSPWDSLLYHKWFLHAGLMAVEPQTGHIKAYVGGINYDFFQFDNVTGGRRQIGSVFKPFIYTMAMADGYLPCDKIPNVQVCIELPGRQDDWCPRNSSTLREGEMVTMQWALARSVNFVSAYLIRRFPPQSVINLVRKMGIEAPIEPVPSIALGVSDISVFEMAGAMATYANRGVFIRPSFITSIVDRNGVVIYRPVPEQNEAMSERTAYLTLRLMQGVTEFGTGVRLRTRYGFNMPIAGKTGTTQNNSDGWWVGITPQLATTVWVGGEVRSIHFPNITYGQGANMALPIWARFMQRVYRNESINLYRGPFATPPGINYNFNCEETEQEDPEGGFDDIF